MLRTEPVLCSEQDLQGQVTLVKSQLRDLRVSNETNQAKLLDHTQRQGTRQRLAHRINVSCAVTVVLIVIACRS